MVNPIAWLVLSIATIASLICAIVFYLRGKERKEFSYYLTSHILIRKKKSKFEKLSVAYDGCQIDDLCVSNYTIWNSGNKVLNANDIVASKELTIGAKDGNRILDAEIIACSDETNKFRVRKMGEHAVAIEFDYVDKREGLVVQLMHTGTYDDLNIGCKIKGGLPIKSYINDRMPSAFFDFLHRDMVRKVIAVISVLVLVCMLAFALISTASVFNADLYRQVFISTKLFVKSSSQTGRHLVGIVSISIILWAYFLFILGIFVPGLKTIFKIGIPSELKGYAGIED